MCKLEVSLLTGIGHDHDHAHTNIVLDEVANARCDMPSKVNAKVEQVIARTVESCPRGRDRGRSGGMSQDAELHRWRKID